VKGGGPEARLALAFDADLAGRMDRHADRTHATWYGRELGVVVDRERARSSAWYELFPCSCGPAGRHGTFRESVEQGGWLFGLDDAEIAEVVAGHLRCVARVCDAFPVGSVLRRNGDRVFDAAPSRRRPGS
jgi:hypothetical protein